MKRFSNSGRSASGTGTPQKRELPLLPHENDPESSIKFHMRQIQPADSYYRRIKNESVRFHHGRKGTNLCLESSHRDGNSLNDLVQCRKCGKAVHVGKMAAEISEIGVTDHNVGFVVRRFQSMSPDCGAFFHYLVGHYGTSTKKQMQ